MKTVLQTERTTAPLWLAALFLLAAAAAARADVPHAIPPVEFQRDIFPILKRRCAACHNPEKQEGQLSLHDRAAIERGGESGRKIVNVPLAENELWRRIAGQDAEVRMPAEGPPLAEEDVATIERWARAGAPWPVAEARTMPPPDNSTWTNWLMVLLPTWLDPYLRQVETWRVDYGSVLYLSLGLLVLALVAQRLKGSEDEDATPLALFLRSYSTRTLYVVLAAGIGVWFVWLYVAKLHLREAEMAGRVAALQAEVKKLTEPPPAAASPLSLEPARPKHPPRLGGTYYRGNDERSPQLFNGGFYRTATMQLALCDLNDRRLAWGDKLPARDVFLRLEIERAPLATPTLFTTAIMAKAFLSPCRPAVRTPGLAALVYPLRTLAEGDKWVGHVPVKLPPPNAAGDILLSGDAFLYNCVPVNEQIPERPHFGIRYRITVKDGVIQPGSDLWMGSLYMLATIVNPPPDKILPNEWFDSREIPVIEGANSSDPQLLGVEEHRSKQ